MKAARKSISITLACLLAVCAVSLIGGQKPQAATDGPLTYVVRNGSATVTKCVYNATGTVEVPAELGGAPVTALADEAFRACSEVKEVILPETLLFIGDRCFDFCFALLRVTLPEGLISLGTAAFHDCVALQSIHFPARVERIGFCPFSECTSLKSVTVDPENPVFYSAGNCIIERAGGTLLAGCGYSEIPQDGSITAIAESAFEYCRELTNVTVPAGVETLGDYAFAGCDAITALRLPDGLKQIGQYAFYNCAQLRSLDLPGSVEQIGAYAFCNCDRLTSLELPESLTEISEYLLYLCPRLLRVTIPRSVRSIGRLFNDGCTLMTDIYYKGTPEDWMRVQIAQQDTEFNDAVLHYIGGTCEKSDAASGVALAFEYGTFGTPNDSTLHLRVETVAQGDARFSAYKVNVDGAQHALYEIHMEDDAGNSYQPQDGKLVTVWIPLPFVIEPESYGAMFIHHRRQDGTTERIKYSTGALRVENDCFVFEVASFSDFAVCSDDQGNHADVDHDHVCDLCGDSLIYTVDLIVNGENLGPVTYYYNDTVASALPPVPARPGYVGAWAVTITGAVIDIHPVYTNPTAQAVLLVQPEATVDYRTSVTLTARAQGVPDGCFLVLNAADGRELARGNSETVSCEVGALTADQVYSVKILDAHGNVCIDAAEAPLEKTVTVTVRNGFFQRLIAFFKGLFGRLGHVEIGP
ncbi:MAG: leucine-rich repeat domain-containing protein [Clostridia bacterium]|nr:leucine-rich repeat domain-containing protein [Clostridia bacterium]